MRRQRLRIAPRPIPGKVVELLHSAVACEMEVLTERAKFGGVWLTDLVFLALVFHGLEGASGRNQALALSPFKQVRRLCFM